MTSFNPPIKTVRMRNATVTAVAGRTVTLGIDGGSIPGVPVYGPVPAVNAGVLVLEQGGGMLVIGNAVSLAERIEALEARIETLERSE